MRHDLPERQGRAHFRKPSTSEQKPSPDYEPRQRRRGINDGCLIPIIIVMGLFSAYMFLMGIIALVFVIHHDVFRHLGGVNTGSDFYEAIMFIVIGLFSGGASLRWTLRRGRR